MLRKYRVFILLDYTIVNINYDINDKDIVEKQEIKVLGFRVGFLEEDLSRGLGVSELMDKDEFQRCENKVFFRKVMFGVLGLRFLVN